MLYDSLVSKKLKLDVEQQISAYSAWQGKELYVDALSVQQQNNGVDCGVFAIAFATSLAFGKDPTETIYDERLLRKHLFTCLCNGKMELFPTSSVRSQFSSLRRHTIHLFCSCRRPWDKSQNSNFDMAKCNSCSEWFHKICEKIPRKTFLNQYHVWNCRSCKTKK